LLVAAEQTSVKQQKRSIYIMAVINTRERRGNGTGESIIIPSDVYRMKITSAAIEEDQYAEPYNDGTKPEKLVLCWEVSQVTDEQEDIFLNAKVWQRFNPWYGTVKAGGPSNFKAFIDKLVEQGLITFDPDNFDTDALVGIEQKCSVEEYTKTMGVNKGQPGNKITQVMPLTRKKTAAPAPKPQPVHNVPQPIDEEELAF
jgi:hypothetical protein